MIGIGLSFNCLLGFRTAGLVVDSGFMIEDFGRLHYPSIGILRFRLRYNSVELA